MSSCFQGGDPGSVGQEHACHDRTMALVGTGRGRGECAFVIWSGWFNSIASKCAELSVCSVRLACSKRGFSHCWFLKNKLFFQHCATL